MKGVSIMSVARRGFALLTPRERRKAIVLSVAIAAAELAQLAAIIAVLPVVGVIVQPEMLEQGGEITRLYDFLGAPGHRGFVMILTGMALVALVVGHLGMLWVNILQERYIARLNVRLSHDLMAALVEAPFVWFLNQNAAALTRVIHNDVTYWNRDLVGNSLKLLSIAITLISTTALVVMVTPMGGLLMLIGAGVLAGVTTRLVKDPMLRWNRIGRAAAENSMVMASQILSGIKDVKANRTQQHFTSLFTEANGRTRLASAKALIWGQVPAATIMLIMQASILLLMLGLWASGAEGGELAAQMALVVLAAARVTPAVIRLQNSVGKLINTLPWVDGLMALMDDARRAAAAIPPSGPAAHTTLASWREIHFRAVGFAYEGGERIALDAVDAVIQRRTCIGLKGPSGAGKSTFVDLLLGLLQPASGKISMDEMPLTDIGPEWLNHVGYVPQQPFFTDDTLAANICMGQRRDDARLAEVCEQAGLGSFVADLPRGFDTPLGDRGQRASGGQRQRIAIARALYRRPDLLVLDEATSALDGETEAALVQTLARLKGRITMIIVSHRKAPMVLCDSVLSFDAGRVVTEISHPELHQVERP